MRYFLKKVLLRNKNDLIGIDYTNYTIRRNGVEL